MVGEVISELNAPGLVDLDSLDPQKVNWFKYIVDKYLTSPSVLNTADAYVNLLRIIISPERHEEIQMELLDLVGAENVDMAT